MFQMKVEEFQEGWSARILIMLVFFLGGGVKNI